MNLREIIQKIKEKNIGIAIINSNGQVAESTLPLESNTAGLIKTLAGYSQAIMNEIQDELEGMEISSKEGSVIVYPFQDKLLVVLAKNKEEKEFVKRLVKG